jgi:hypothetical protein
MSDPVLTVSNIMNFPSQLQEQGKSPLAQLEAILKNPAGMFTGFGDQTNNALSLPEDFKTNPEMLAASQTEQKGETKKKPEFPLPENGKPKGDEPIDDKYKNPDGSTKTAEQIIKESPASANFGRKGDAGEIVNNAKKDFGDWEKEPDKEKAARSAIKFRELAEFADHANDKNGNDRKKEEGNGKISGFTGGKGNQVRNGTEGAIMADYFRKGRQFVVDTHGDGINKEAQLSATKDKYVRNDGSTRSNASQVGVDIGKGIGRVLPGLGNFIAGASDGLDKGGVKGGIKGAFEGVKYSAVNGLKVLDPTDPKGMAEGAKNLWGGGFTSTL